MKTWMKALCLGVVLTLSAPALAAVSIPFTVNLSEAVNVDTTVGTPRIAVDIGGITRYATYTAGTGTSSLTFTYDAVIGDVDLDGVTLTSPIQLNGGTIKDAVGNDAALTFALPNTTGVMVNYPSLGMDFAADADGRYTLNGTVYNDLSSFLTATGGTFSRNSIGTYFDSTGTLQTASANTPRFDYDPVTLQPKGILIEETRANRIPNSYFENWTTAYPTSWNNPGNNITKVAGVFGTNAMRITGPLANNVNRISTSGLNLTASTAYTLTVRVKLISGTGTLALALDPWSNTAFSFSTASMVAGQYVTLSQTQTIPATGTTSGGFHTSGTAIIVDLDYVQLEQGAFATSYIPTTTVAVTRAKDVISIPINSWFNPEKGTAYSSWDKYTNASTIVFEFKDSSGATSDRISVISGSQKSRLQFFPLGVSAFDRIYTPFAADTLIKGIVAYKSGSSTATSDGANPIDSGSAFSDLTQYTKLNIGQTDNGIYGAPVPSGALNGHINKFRYYPERISNIQLQLITQ